MPSTSQTFRYYLKQLSRYPRLFIPSLVLLPVNFIVNSYLPPIILSVVIGRLSRHDFTPHAVWASFGNLLILYGVIAFVGGALMWRLYDIFYWRLIGKVEGTIARQIFSKLVDESADFHANQFGGSLVSDGNKLIGAFDRMMDTTYFTVAPLLVGLIFTDIVMAGRAPLYAAILTAVSLFYVAISFVATKDVRRRGAEVAASESKQTAILADMVTNAMVVKSFAQEDHERQRLANQTDKTYRKIIGQMWAFQKQQVVLGSVNSGLLWLSLVAAIVSVVSFDASVATAFLIFNFTSSIVSQLFQFSNSALRNYSRAIGDASGMLKILALQPSVKDPEKPEKLHISSGEINFKNVTFTHNGADDALFDDFSLKIKPGEKVGLVGHSGSGKTSFTRLLLRFSDLDGGQISIDGQNIASITQADLHGKIAYVPQEPLLFHRTVRENIAYGRLEASDAEIKAVAKMASAHDFIKDLPKGYDTLVGERGVKLSGGQRQRIAIARAMLKNAPVLVLDEATSALDSESEVLIQAALWKLMEGRTAIVIAHRLSTIQKMDRIIVLDDGQIVEQGSHKELLAAGGTYARLWQHQSGGFLKED